MIQGIGAGFVPEVLNTDLIDEVMLVSNEEAIETARKLAVLEGIPAGISSGAALACAIRVAQRDQMKGRTVVTVFPDCAERYISRRFLLTLQIEQTECRPIRPIARPGETDEAKVTTSCDGRGWLQLPHERTTPPSSPEGVRQASSIRRSSVTRPHSQAHGR
jgi:hypothetical protein